MAVLKRLLAAALSDVGVRYVLVGGASFLFNFSIFYLCHKVLGLWYVYATVVAGSVAWLVNFPLHKFWTFNDPRLGSAPLQGAAHFSLKLWNTYFFDLLLLYVLVEFVGLDPLWSKVLTSFCIGVQNYIVCRYLIFRKPAA